ncbi:Imm1 family immunity protein [Actinoplanes sp. NPDC051411]|uniref:Imm1 family immunity protein n=1 Tax=Actinoplanes sp. NPDC051411 TaxID=3155522 RepID=UPI003429360A
MPLNVWVRGEHHVAHGWDEMSEEVETIMNTLGYEQYVTMGRRQVRTFVQNAKLSFSDDLLWVGINNQTGYGALIWLALASSPKKGGIYNYTWVSDNPNPPTTDPQVIADPSVVYFHDPRNALPLADIRTALEEYCRTGTGDRPESISWVRGGTDGRRFDGKASTD